MAEPKNIKWEKDGYLGILSLDNPPGKLFYQPGVCSYSAT